MKKSLTYLSLCCIAFFFSIVSLNAQSFKWVKGGGTNQSLAIGEPGVWKPEGTYAMCTDVHGNMYALSEVGDNPIVADTFIRLTGAYGANANIMLTSYNCAGQMRWAKLLASSGGECYPYSIVTDNSGHVYVGARVTNGTFFIGYDTSVSGLLNQYECLIQFDTSGEFNWIHYLGDNTTATYLGSRGTSFLVMDASDNVHYINGTKYGAHITPTLTSHWGYYDLTFNSSATLLSVNRLQLDSTLDIGGVALDKPTNKLYAYGYRNYSMFPDSSIYVYIASFDPTRNLIWKDTMADPTSEGSEGFSGIAVDGMGHIYLSGAGPTYVIYQGDTIRNYVTTGYVSFMMKMDTNSHVRHITKYGANTSINVFNGLTLMPGNKIAMAGVMGGIIVSGTDTAISYSGEGQNSFFTILDSAGYVHTIQQIHGTGFYDKANVITSDGVGNLYIGGQVAVDTWGGTLTPYTSIGGTTDYYLMKYGMDCSCTTMPVANYTQTGTTTRTFTYTGTTAGIDSVRWEFGDGGTSIVLNPTHTYTTGDTFTACITVYTSCGSDMHCSDFIIPCVAAPTASFTASGTGLTKTFTYTGTGLGIGTLSWTFGDTYTGAGTPAIHTYAASGSYLVCVTATNACGTNSSCTSIAVSCTTSPVSNYTVGGSGLTRSFTYTGTTAGMDSVTWTFGDGGTYTGLTPSHTFSAAGTYVVCATVHTNCGNNTHCSSVVVTCTTLPVAAYTSGGSTLVKSFAYTGTTAGMDSVTWTFGDGGTATGISPSHTYAAAGIYTVCATVHTNCGANTHCSNITVTCASLPVSAFTYTVTGASASFTFTGTTASVDSVRWNFGDGGTATTMTPGHTYTGDGTYHVCVTIYTNCGNSTICHDVVITCSVPVLATFADTGHILHGFAYTGTTTGLDSVVWNYGDGHTGSGITAVHTYAVADTYHICVTVYTSCGNDTVCRDIIITSATGITSLSRADVKVYPNPATDELYITGIEQITGYRLLTVTGVDIQKGILPKGNNTISLPNFASGIYILEMIRGDGEKTIVRIVKQ